MKMSCRKRIDSEHEILAQQSRLKEERIFTKLKESWRRWRFVWAFYFGLLIWIWEKYFVSRTKVEYFDPKLWFGILNNNGCSFCNWTDWEENFLLGEMVWMGHWRLHLGTNWSFGGQKTFTVNPIVIWADQQADSWFSLVQDTVVVLLDIHKSRGKSK